jgi:hypothetical protein
MPEELVFYDCEIIANDKDTFSGIVLEPGVNRNGCYYSKEDVARFALQLPKVPLVKDHSMKAEDSVGSFFSGTLREDGAAIGHFRVSQTEPVILAKVRDGTLKNLSVAHTKGASQYCNICGNPINSKQCTHMPLVTYNGVKCGVGYKDPVLVHVSLVQMGWGEGCSVVLNAIDAKAKSLAEEIAELKLINAKHADELAKLRALKLPEPQGKIHVAPLQEPVNKPRTLKDEFLG